MNSNIEIEAKVLLLKEEYDTIIRELQLDKYRKVTQTNHYIDTKDSFLKRNGIALRVREKNEEFELTLKTPLTSTISPPFDLIISASSLSSGWWSKPILSSSLFFKTKIGESPQ